MKAIEAIRTLYTMGAGNLKFIEAMQDNPLARPAGGGNHAWWTLGHLALAEARLHQILTGEPNALADLKPMFDWGSTPSDDGAGYPPFAELLAKYKLLRDKTMAYLDTLDDAKLDGATKVQPPGLEEVFGKIGPTLIILASHQAFHCGQVAAARRAAGGQPFFQPSEALRAF